MHLNSLVLLSIAAIVAYFVKKGSGRLGMPIVTGYVLVGVALGMSLLKVYTLDSLEHLEMVNDLALGIIGFTIGSELRHDVFKKLGKAIFWIATLEAFMAFALVFGVLMLISPDKPYLALILGAVASATAPAATVYVIQQYKAKGPLTSTIMAVVGIDDAIALTIFVFASTITKGLMSAEHISILSIIFVPMIEIMGSVVVGVLLGLLFVWLFRKVRFPDDLVLGCAAFILANLGIAEMLHFSGLLAVMAFGAVVTNMNVMLANRGMKVLESFSPLLFAYFFIFGGAHLDVSLFPTVGGLGLIYLLVRATGKIGGASLGAWIGKAPKSVRKFVGLSLIPQVGVAIALAIMVRKEFGTPEYGEAGEYLSVVVINILLFTTIITEIVGPLLTKWALKRAGEIGDP